MGNNILKGVQQKRKYVGVGIKDVYSKIAVKKI